MADELLTMTPPATFQIQQDKGNQLLLDLLADRRSYRRLRSGPFTIETQVRLLEALRLTPCAFNLPSWHAVLVHADRDAFWAAVEAGFRERLEGDRLDRYLDRLDGFRNGVAIALFFEDVPVRDDLIRAWNLTHEQAYAFAEQGIGMAQLSLWLALTAEGLVTSLQHWEWLIGDILTEFAGVPPEQFRLVATLPIGYPAEAPRSTEPIPIQRLVSRDRYDGYSFPLKPSDEQPL
jgi:predicted oxidoreductase (fatty acid repression mutant protein)